MNSGTLNLENIEEFANEIYETLKGKKYTFASANELFNYKVDVHNGQQLKDDTSGSPLSFWKTENYAGFNFSDSYGVWGASTSRKESGYDPEYNSPYISIEWHTITITQRSGAGYLLQWTISLE